MAAWERQADESAKAYAAFEVYYLLPPRSRSIDAAWRAADPQQDRSGKRAPGHWMGWSTAFSWVERAAAYDEHLAEQDRLLWEDRRRDLQRRDWEQADALRNVVDEALPNANQFIRRRTTTLRGRTAVMDADGNIVVPGAPDREIVTLEFDIQALATVLEKASKLQRLATNEPTDNLGLSGSALDDAIARGLAKLADAGQKAASGANQPTNPRDNGGKAGGMA